MSDLRFSRNKRFGKISFAEFKKSSFALFDVIQSVFRQDATVQMYVCFTKTAYDWAHVTFCNEEVAEGLKQLIVLPLSELTESLWNKALQIEVVITDPSSTDYFRSSITCDRLTKPKSMYFFARHQGERLDAVIKAAFKTSSFNYAIGDGVPPVSEFNALYAMSGRWRSPRHEEW